ncbi:MAG TPA: tyrosine-type recombinase/integrase [Tissierellaceae bacterium]|nr:tyrosine-type recombinase/integrase [Tissierellaceae bacterium]
MNINEATMRIVTKLDRAYGDKINLSQVRQIIEGVLYDYDITLKETLPAVIDNMRDNILMYLAVRKTEGLADNTIENYGRVLGRFSRYMRRNVEDVSSMDIRMYLANYMKTGVKSATIANATDILRGFYNWLHAEGYVEKNPMTLIKTIKVESRLREPLTYEEMERLRLGCKTPRQKTLLEFTYSSMARLSEIISVNISDINWHEKKLNIIGKGNKERTIYFNARAKIYMQKYLESRDDDCPALFVTERKPIRRVSDRAIQREIDKIQEQSGLQKNVHIHLLRHTGATHMYLRGASIEFLQEILGHESVDTTKIYIHNIQSNVEYDYRKYMAN